MAQYPRAVGGEGRFSTVLMECTRGRLVAKGGAEGLECVGMPDRGLGIAIKCEDGAGRPMAPATLALLERVGGIDPAELDRLKDSRRPVLRNHAGTEVGRLDVTIRAEEPARAAARVEGR
jgi:L-asparaginase II